MNGTYFKIMKHLLLTTIAAMVLVGCGPSVDIWTAAYNGQIEIVKTHLNNGVDVNVNHPKLRHSHLWFACDGGHLSTSSLLMKKVQIKTQLYLKVIELHLE